MREDGRGTKEAAKMDGKSVRIGVLTLFVFLFNQAHNDLNHPNAPTEHSDLN